MAATKNHLIRQWLLIATRVTVKGQRRILHDLIQCPTSDLWSDQKDILTKSTPLSCEWAVRSGACDHWLLMADCCALAPDKSLIVGRLHFQPYNTSADPGTQPYAARWPCTCERLVNWHPQSRRGTPYDRLLCHQCTSACQSNLNPSLSLYILSSETYVGTKIWSIAATIWTSLVTLRTPTFWPHLWPIARFPLRRLYYLTALSSATSRWLTEWSLYSSPFPRWSLTLLLVTPPLSAKYDYV